MRAGSLFTGIGGFDLGFERAGIEVVWQAEIDKNCLKLLEQKFPKARRYTDVREITRDTAEPVDVICGGFPCQDLSVAGRRAGLAGERSGLWFEFHRIVKELQPRWVVIENVPGLLSSNKGRDMGILLGGLAQLGYGWAYRVLDSQYFGVAQRRRRVFIVGCLGGGRRAAQVLFEPESGERDTPPSRETREGTAAYAASGFGESGQGYWGEGIKTLRAEGENRPSRPSNLVAYNIQNNDGGSHKRKDRPNGGMYVNETETSLTVGSTDRTVVAQRTVGALQARDGKGIGTTIDDKIITTGWDSQTKRIHDPRLPAPTLAGSDGKGGQCMPYVWHENQGGNFATDADGLVKALKAGASHNYQGVGVRRLTPLECERLQAFPDGWTDGFSDSTRYRMLGNAVTVNVIEWLAKRLKKENDEI